MTSFVVPLATWIGPTGYAEVTRAVASDDGSRVVVGLSSGQLRIHTFGGIDALKCFDLTSDVYLLGHKTSVTILTLCKIDVDGPVRKENIIISGSRDGEVIMWDLFDGRALQSNPDAFPGELTTVTLSSSGKVFLCAGYSNIVSVLNSSTLEVLKKINVLDNWIVSLSIVPSLHSTDGKKTETAIVVGVDGDIYRFHFDESKVELISDQLALSGGFLAFSSCHGFVINRFLPSLCVVIQSEFCSVLTCNEGEAVVATRIPVLSSEWIGAQFLSSNTLLLWSMRGDAYIYFVGKKCTLTFGVHSELAENSKVLLSDGYTYCWIDGTNTTGLQGSQEIVSVLIGHFSGNQCTQGPIICPVVRSSDSRENPSHVLVFDGCDGSVCAWSFWFDFEQQLSKSLSKLSRSCEVGSTIVPSPAYITFTGILAKSPSKLLSTIDQFAISAAVILSETAVALGLSTGSIIISPVMNPFLIPSSELLSSSSMVMNGHSGKISALFHPEPSEYSQRRFLLSSAEDCTIKLWNIENGSLLITFSNQVSPIQTFVSMPVETSTKSKNVIVSVCKQQSVSILDLEDLRCLQRFAESLQPVVSVHWRISEDCFIVNDCTGTISIWQMKTGHLDRVESSSVAEDILSSCDVTVQIRDPKFEYRTAISKQTISAFPVFSFDRNGNEYPMAFVLLINLKRLINGILSGKHILTPPQSPKLHNIQSSASSKGLGISAKKEPSAHIRTGSNIVEFFKTGRQSNQGSPHPRSKSPLKRISLYGSIEDLAGGYQPGAVDATLLHGILSAVLSWGLDPNVDCVCSTRLGLKMPPQDVAFALRGANGHLAVMCRTPDIRKSWCISPTSSGFQLLRILSLVRAILSIKGSEDDALTILSMYGPAFPSIIGNRYEFPSFSYLAKYWQDPLIDIQQAARTVFSATLSRMSADEKMATISYWHPHLPAVTKKSTKINFRATIILGIIGSEDPTILTNRLCKDIAESLNQLLNDDVLSPHRITAIELLSRGFPTWEPHINSAAVVRTIIASTGLAATAGATVSSPMKESMPPSAAKDGLSNALMMTARQAVVQIASSNAALFLSTITFDFAHSKNPSERVGGLKLLGMFIAKKPLVLFPHLNRIIEAMVKALDPNVSGMREALQPVVTANFAELVRIFPNVAFHHGSQRLAHGTQDGLAVVYDLKTATRIQILEGHSKPVTAVAFSSEGKLIVTFSLEENSVRFWQPAGGFLNSLVGAFNTTSGSNAFAGVGGVGHMKSFRQFSVGPPDTAPLSTILEMVKFEWLVYVAHKSQQQMNRTYTNILKGLIASLKQTAMSAHRLSATWVQHDFQLHDDTFWLSHRAVKGNVKINATVHCNDGKLSSKDVDISEIGFKSFKVNGVTVKKAETSIFFAKRINDVSFSSSGGLLIVGGDDGAAAIYDTTGWDRRVELQGHVADVTVARLFPSDQVALTGGRDMTLRIWNLNALNALSDGSSACAPALAINTGGVVSDVAIIERGRNVLSCSRNCVSLWELSSNLPVWTISLESVNCISVGTTPFMPATSSAMVIENDNKEFFTGDKTAFFGCSGYLTGYDLGSKLKTFNMQTSSRTAIASCFYDASSGTVLAGSQDGLIDIFDLKMPSRPCLSFHRDEAEITRLLSNSSGVFFTNSDGAAVRCAVSSSGVTVDTEFVGVDIDPLHALAVNPQHTSLVTGGRDKILRIYSIV